MLFAALFESVLVKYQKSGGHAEPGLRTKSAWGPSKLNPHHALCGLADLGNPRQNDSTADVNAIALSGRRFIKRFLAHHHLFSRRTRMMLSAALLLGAIACHGSDGVVQFSVAPYTGSARTATLTITGTAITITQSAP
jgi:hypothetical protein